MAKKGISFIDIIKVIIALIPIGIKLFKEMRKKEDQNEKNEVLKAIRDGDIDTIHKLLGDLSEPGGPGPDRGSEDSPPT